MHFISLSFGRRAGLIGICLLILSGCALPALNLITPHSGYDRETGLEYGPEPRQQLDYYQARNPLAGAPLIVFFYGGSWESGYKEGYRFVAQALSKAGYDVVIPDYRLHPEVVFPVFLNDAAAAVAWTLETRQPEHGVVLAGHSAGAHIAAMLAMDDRYLAAAGVDRSEIRAWIGLSGPYDFLPLTDPDLIEIFGGADGIPQTQPINFVSADDPPALLVSGDEDTVVRPHNQPNIAEALREVGVPVETRIYPGVNHNGTVASFSVRLRERSPAFTDSLEFLQQFHSQP